MDMVLYLLREIFIALSSKYEKSRNWMRFLMSQYRKDSTPLFWKINNWSVKIYNNHCE